MTQGPGDPGQPRRKTAPDIWYTR